MAKNQTGIAIVVKAWLPLGGSLESQIASLQLVKNAHATGDYTALLNAAKVEDVKAEQKTRRVEDEPEPAPQPDPQPEPERATEGKPLLEMLDAATE